MTWLDEISLEQKELIEELKKRTINECTEKALEDPTIFYRFLKGCNFNLKNAETMLRKHIAWRKENKIDTILTDYKCKEVLQKYIPLSRIGFDKEDCPVCFVGFFGKFDEIGVLKSCTFAEFLKFVAYKLEENREIFRQQSLKIGRLISQMVYIFDFEGLTLQKATNKAIIEVVLQMLHLFQNNYPEFVKNIYMINASKYFTILFSVLKLFITTGLMSKIQIFGSDGYKEKLVEIIDEEVLPAFLGGKKTDPDGNPFCPSFVCQVGKVPEKYYIPSIKHGKGVKKLLAERRSTIEIAIDVVHPCSILMWEFEIKNRDIGFGIRCKNNSRNIEEIAELIPMKRIDTLYIPEKGTYKCKNAGTYFLVFDNSYSWLYSKEIYYKAKVIPPSAD